MQRGIINFSQQELTVLYNLAVFQNCEQKGLLAKLKPVEFHTNKISEKTQIFKVLLSEDEAEILLDLMSIPSDQEDPNLNSSRIKIQQFIAKIRFEN